MQFLRKYAILAALCLAALRVSAQQTAPIIGQDTLQNPIITAVPFLSIGPDARSAGMGEAGVAISADANAGHWNTAKFAFIEKESGVAFSYTPWLQKIVGDMNLAYLSGYKKISKTQVVSASMRYFDLGSMEFTDNNANIIQNFNPREFAFDASYAMKLSDRFGIGFSGRFIYSNLSGNISSSAINSRPGTTFGIDLSAFYTNEDLTIAGYNSTFALGADISNIGFKVTYSNQSQEDFIPTNLRLGTALTTELDPFNKITFALDLNKLMVPTPVFDAQGNREDPSLFAGLMGSFADAPNGFSEEINEVMIATGIEYWYSDIFAARGGYFHEANVKGGRQYFTLGLGLKYQLFGLDFSYLIARRRNHPLEDTIRFTLHLNFEKAKSAQSPTGVGEGI